MRIQSFDGVLIDDDNDKPSIVFPEILFLTSPTSHLRERCIVLGSIFITSTESEIVSTRQHKRVSIYIITFFELIQVILVKNFCGNAEPEARLRGRNSI